MPYTETWTMFRIWMKKQPAEFTIVDCKADIIEVIEEEIDIYEAILSGPDTDEDNDMDYDALCLIQGLSRYA